MKKLTKKQKLDVLLQAAERLQYSVNDPCWPSGSMEYSCLAIRFYDKGSSLANDYRDFTQAHEYDFRTEKNQLARQLAVLMYREAVKNDNA